MPKRCRLVDESFLNRNCQSRSLFFLFQEYEGKHRWEISSKSLETEGLYPGVCVPIVLRQAKTKLKK